MLVREGLLTVGYKLFIDKELLFPMKGGCTSLLNIVKCSKLAICKVMAESKGYYN